MLNRNAEALFWIGRYMERAENHARLIDVHYHQQLDMDMDEAKPESAIWETDHKWSRIVDSLGSSEAYEAQYGRYNERDVLFYTTLDRDNSNSLISCISHARGNLRTLREKVPSELWDTINAFYLWLRDRQPAELLEESPHLFFNRIKQWTAMFQGVSQSVMPRENEWHFIECGRYLERSENTLRIIKAVGNAIGGEASGTGIYSYLQAVLRSVSGYQVFRRYYADGMVVETIVEFVILNEVFPRSIRYALHSLDEHMRNIELQDKGLRTAHERVLRLVGKVKADLDMLEREDLLIDRYGLVVAHLLDACQQLGTAFAKTFFRMGEASA